MNINEYNGRDLVVVSIVFLIITYISVILRCFVRLKLIRGFSADDWLMLIAQGNFTVSCIFIFLGVHFGLGHHNVVLSQSDEIQALKWQTLITIAYVSNMMFIKLSIALFLLRIAVKKRFIWTLKISIVVVSLWSIAIFLFGIFQCQPIAAQWDTTLTDFHCVSADSFVASAYSISVMSIISDWMYALMPIFMIWSTKMTINEKITVGFILSLGVFASIATLIRLRYLVDLEDVSDILFSATNAEVWTVIEPGIAITAASLVTIRPLLRAMNFNGFGSSRSRTRSGYPSAQPHISLRDDVASGTWNHSVASGPLKSHPSVRNKTLTTDTESEEYILQGISSPGHIMRRTEISVSHDSRPMRDGMG